MKSKEERNARDRLRYENDTEYRERKKARAYARYRTKREEILKRGRERRAANPSIHRATNKASRDTRREKIAESKRRDKGIVYAVGESFAVLRQKQQDMCPICGRSLAVLPKKLVHVDHDHSISDGSPNVRSVLCHRCNVGLGMFDDNVAALTRAIEYINSWNERTTNEGPKVHMLA